MLARLFPSAYPEDEKAAEEFRRYTEATLRDGKRDAATVLETLAPGRVTLTPEQAHAWLRALNDVRLALGVRLDVTEDRSDEEIARMPEDDPRYPAFITYDWLTYLQDTLVRALW